MNLRVVSGGEVTTRRVYCQQCSVLDGHATARDVRAHVKATGHDVSVAVTSQVIYRRELTP